MFVEQKIHVVVDARAIFPIYFPNGSNECCENHFALSSLIERYEGWSF